MLIVNSGIERKEGGTVRCMQSHGFRRLAGAFVISVGVVSSAWAQQDDDVVARVGGDPITFADLEEASPAPEVVEVKVETPADNSEEVKNLSLKVTVYD